ncbi:UNVERIFIED_CONTAM: hypothetical protein K2H54_069307 [Gekko kuhli]
MDQVASLVSVQAPGTTTVHATVRLASVSVELDLKASRVISVPLATSATLCVNFVAAVLLGHCRKAVMLLAGVIVNLNMMVFIVTSAASDIIPTLTAKLAPVTPGALWTITVAQLVSVNATQTT